MIKQRYDLIFSIGEACSCTDALRKSCLQFYSYPFDWLYGATFIERCKIISSNFENWLNKENLVIVGENNISKIPKNIYKNNLTKICFNHDFIQNEPFDDAYMQVKQKYDRRISRLLEHIEKSEKVLVVYIQTPNNKVELNKNEIMEGYNILKRKFGNKINILYLYSDSRYNLKNCLEVDLNDNIKCVSYDYDAYNKDVPYVVNQENLLPIFNKINITNRFLTNKNKIKRLKYKIKLFFRGLICKDS